MSQESSLRNGYGKGPRKDFCRYRPLSGVTKNAYIDPLLTEELSQGSQQVPRYEISGGVRMSQESSLRNGHGKGPRVQPVCRQPARHGEAMLEEDLPRLAVPRCAWARQEQVGFTKGTSISCRHALSETCSAPAERLGSSSLQVFSRVPSNVSLHLVGSHTGGSPSIRIWSLMHQSFPTARSHRESARKGHHRSSEVKAVATTLEDVSQNRAQSVFLKWTHDLGLASVCYFRDASWACGIRPPSAQRTSVELRQLRPRVSRDMPCNVCLYG